LQSRSLATNISAGFKALALKKYATISRKTENSRQEHFRVQYFKVIAFPWKQFKFEVKTTTD
jgi:hypothetical protein